MVRGAGTRLPADRRARRGIASRKEDCVTKKTDKKPRQRRIHDWQPLFAAIKDVIDWALDIAVQLSRDFPDDVEAIEKVRSCFHAWLDGRPCEMELNDLLLTFAAILSAIEVDLGIRSAELLAPLRALVDAPSTLPRVLRLPADDAPRSLVSRRSRLRNASGGLSHRAA
jgi:hypothetical protein